MAADRQAEQPQVGAPRGAGQATSSKGPVAGGPESVGAAGEQALGLASCTAAQFNERAIGLAFIVQAPIALVLDVPEVSLGNIMGVLCSGDVAVPSQADLPWIRLPAGSFARHPKMRAGRVRLPRDGWMLTEHTDFGRLLAPHPTDEVERGFAEGHFLKLPFVKPPPAQQQSPAAARTGSPQSAAPMEGATHELPKAMGSPAGGQVGAPPNTGVVGTPPEQRLSVSRALALMEELLRGYNCEAFREACHRLDLSWGSHRRFSDRVDEIDALCLSMVLGPVIARYGFPGNMEGMREVSALVAALAHSSQEVMEEHRTIQKLIVSYFPNYFGRAGEAPAGAQPKREDSAVVEPPGGGEETAHVGGTDTSALAPPVAAEQWGQESPKEVSEAMEPFHGKPRASLVQPVYSRPGKLAAEGFPGHLARCRAQHYKVVHWVVFVRDWCSTEAGQLNVCYRECCICTQCATSAITASGEGTWVSCAPGARFWRSPEATHPEALLPGATTGYILREHPEHGVLIELIDQSRAQAPGEVPPPSPAVSAARSAERGEVTAEGRGEAAQADGGHAVSMHGIDRADPEPMPELSALDHWVVERSAGLQVFQRRDEMSGVRFALAQGDVIVLGQRPPDLQLVGIKCWLQLEPGARVFRQGSKVCPPGLPGFVVTLHEGEVWLRQSSVTSAGVILRMVSGFGEPWVVQHDQVVVRRGPSVNERVLGILNKGDIVGVRQVSEDWAQLVRDSNVRLKTARADTGPVYSINELRTTKLEPMRVGDKVKYRAFAAPPAKAEPPAELWMMLRHAAFGQLLARRPRRGARLEGGCVVSEERLRIYREVVELCHKRIFEDNLESLWHGEREKLPTPQTIEAKLFDGGSTVIHATVEGRFAGGAIVKDVHVRAHGGESGVNVGLATAHQSHHVPGRTSVGYVDSCATEPGLHAGSAIWEAISGMHFLCVACHSILLQGTVDFWSHRGLRRYDPHSRSDCEEFLAAILMRTQGTVMCELEDLQRALPASQLPLFIWIPKNIGEIEGDPHQDYIFTPDSPGEEEEVPARP